jgi:hypothetical protein
MDTRLEPTSERLIYLYYGTSVTGTLHTNENAKIGYCDWSVIEAGSFGAYNKAIRKEFFHDKNL